MDVAPIFFPPKEQYNYSRRQLELFLIKVYITTIPKKLNTTIFSNMIVYSVNIKKNIHARFFFHMLFKILLKRS